MRPLDPRAAELLCDEVLEGLDEAEARELAALLGAVADEERASFERAAAAVDLAHLDPAAEALPEALRQRVLADAEAFLATSAARPATNGPAANDPATVLAPAPVVARPDAVRRAGGRTWRDALPWLVAAACLAVAVVAVVVRPAPPPPQVTTVVMTVSVPVPPPAPPPAAERRAQLLAAGGAVVRSAWGNTKDPASAGVSGDVVWNSRTQEGYMTFRGLPANDPTRTQYQLWIFDQNQDERHPVDGGVFDIAPGSSEAVVPITAKLAVHTPTLFAVTIEKPGGVVVSSRQRLVLAAKVPAG